MPGLSLPPALSNLLEYYCPLATFSHGWPGGESLLAPGTNLLGANAIYLPEDADEALAQASAWAREHDLPAVQVRLGAGEVGEAGHLRYGKFAAQVPSGALLVEQVSRLQLPVWAGVLAEAHGQPAWATALSRHLAPRLEGQRGVALLLAYAGHEAVGALLWQSSGAHLWGTLDECVDAALLSAAAELSGGEVLVSLTDTSPLSVQAEQEVTFIRLE